MAHVRAQVELGPRPPGSPASQRLREQLRRELEPLGYTVEEQRFQALTPRGPQEMVNVLASASPVGGRPAPAGPPPGEGSTGVLVLGAHYDTWPTERFRFVGANDGASGVAVLLELARVFAERPLGRELRLVFFDGEEAQLAWSATDGTYGSRHLASTWQGSGELARIQALLILDMVGARDLRLTRDLNSHPQLLAVLVEEAGRLGLGGLFDGAPQAIEDDHLPFARLGVPSVDVIGFQVTPAGPWPPTWHTAEDTIQQLSEESLERVGRLVEAALRRLDRELPR